MLVNMSIVNLREDLPQHQVRSPEHADAPVDPFEALHHHRQQSSRLADRYFRFIDDMTTYFELGGAPSPRAALEMMREAEGLRRSALESVVQLSAAIYCLEQQPVGEARREESARVLALVKGATRR